MEHDRLDYQTIQAFDVRVKYRRLPLHLHNIHEFFLCISGSGEQLVSGGIEPMRPGDLFFFPGGDPHRGSGSVGEDCIGAVVNFGDDLFDHPDPGSAELLRTLRRLREWTRVHGHLLPLSADGRHQAARIIRTMVAEHRTRRPGSHGALLILAQQLVLTFLRDMTFLTIPDADQVRSRQERMDYACAFLEKNGSRPLTVAEVCAELGMSRSHFHAEFLRHTGLTMTAYLNRLRVRQAVRMLRHGDYAVPDIARYCGFGSPASFYRAVRQESGRTPSELRRLG